jgi:acetyl-CoA carboxylase biotin carboxylase subunit
LIDRVRNAAVALASELGYVGAGTCEFLVDTDRDQFVFLEINARVQVEHPVTEMVSGIDIVREQFRIARGEPLTFAQEDVIIRGHAIECRVNAEDPERDFVPDPGLISEWVVPQGDGVRVDTAVYPGARVSPYYDSLIAKVIVHAATRSEAIAKMGRVLSRMRVEGISTTIGLQKEIMSDPDFSGSPITTKWLEDVFLPGRAAADRRPEPA